MKGETVNSYQAQSRMELTTLQRNDAEHGHWHQG
jgi:hypothetical protein